MQETEAKETPEGVCSPEATVSVTMALGLQAVLKSGCYGNSAKSQLETGTGDQG